jgi:hypothetical protein
MPALGTKLYNWKRNQLSYGPFGLDAKIEKENASNEGGTVWRVRKVRLENCIASKDASKKGACRHGSIMDDRGHVPGLSNSEIK